jgi:hypothetical protein
MIIRFVFLGLFLVSAAAFGQTVELITTEEAKQPAAAAKPPSRAITRGPGVRLISPESVSGTFAFRLAFEPRGESKINTSSVKVEYLRGPVIDLTGRVKHGIKPTGIDIPAAAAPPGEHPIRVTVRDSEGRLGMVELKLTVK